MCVHANCQQAASQQLPPPLTHLMGSTCGTTPEAAISRLSSNQAKLPVCSVHMPPGAGPAYMRMLFGHSESPPESQQGSASQGQPVRK